MLVGEGTELVERTRNVYSSSYASDVLTCRLPDGSSHEILCKYGARETLANGHGAHGTRRGPAYEAYVYKELIERSGLPAPHCFGAFRDPVSGEAWLLLEWLGAYRRISKTREVTVPLAAEWAGRFHAFGERHLGTQAAVKLIRYTPDYYEAWLTRTAEMTARMPGVGWVPAVCEAARSSLARLCERPTVIHGEFYPHNILLVDGVVYPVDWESAAIGAGELDLAALTHGWPEDVVHACESAYVGARWPDGEPDDFRERLALARMFMSFRWLGDRPEWTRLAHHTLEELREAAKTLGMAM